MSICALRARSFSSMEPLVLPAPALCRTRTDSVTSKHVDFDVNFGELEPLVLAPLLELRRRRIEITTDNGQCGSPLTLVDSCDLTNCPRLVHDGAVPVAKKEAFCRKLRGKFQAKKSKVKAVVKKAEEATKVLGDEWIYEEAGKEEVGSEQSLMWASPWDVLEKATWQQRQRDCCLRWYAYE